MLTNQSEYSDNLNTFYKNLDKLFEHINQLYPQIQCRTGCNRCCKFYGSPDVYDFEWENIKNFIEANFNEKDLKRVFRKLQQGIINSEEDFNSIQTEKFSECPFIYKNACSIYQQRPFICRIFGYSKLEDQIMTCSEELNQWETIDSRYLPDKDDLEKKLLSFNSTADYKTITEWLEKYFENKREDIL